MQLGSRDTRLYNSAVGIRRSASTSSTKRAHKCVCGTSVAQSAPLDEPLLAARQPGAPLRRRKSKGPQGHRGLQAKGGVAIKRELKRLQGDAHSLGFLKPYSSSERWLALRYALGENKTTLPKTPTWVTAGSPGCLARCWAVGWLFATQPDRMSVCPTPYAHTPERRLYSSRRKARR